MEYGVTFENRGGVYRNGSRERHVRIVAGLNGKGPILYESSSPRDRTRLPKFNQIASICLESKIYIPQIQTYFYRTTHLGETKLLTHHGTSLPKESECIKTTLGNFVRELYDTRDSVVMNLQISRRCGQFGPTPILQVYALSGIEVLVDGTGRTQEEILAELRRYWQLD